MTDFIAISDSLNERIIEYADRLHEHFIEPVVIKDRAYMPPMLPGYSIIMKEQTLIDYDFANGII